jgi:antitoxin YefM
MHSLKGVFQIVALRTVDLRNDFKRVSEIVHAGEPVLIARPHNENLIVVSERQYNEMARARRNEEYLAKIEESIDQVRQGKVITKTIDELETLAK